MPPSPRSPTTLGRCHTAASRPPSTERTLRVAHRSYANKVRTWSGVIGQSPGANLWRSRPAVRLRRILVVVLQEGAHLVEVQLILVEQPVPGRDRDRVPEIGAGPGRDDDLELGRLHLLPDPVVQALDRCLVQPVGLVPDHDATVLQVVDDLVWHRRVRARVDAPLRRRRPVLPGGGRIRAVAAPSLAVSEVPAAIVHLPRADLRLGAAGAEHEHHDEDDRPERQDAQQRDAAHVERAAATAAEATGHRLVAGAGSALDPGGTSFGHRRDRIPERGGPRRTVARRTSREAVRRLLEFGTEAALAAASHSPEVEMTQAEQSRQRESIVGLARRLIGGMVQLGRLELARGRQEIGEMVGEVKSGAILIGIAVGLLLLAMIALVDFVILGVAALLSFLPSWLVALLFFVLLVLLAALLAWRGIRKIRVGPPEETIAAVKEDIAWAKRLLRRG